MITRTLVLLTVLGCADKTSTPPAEKPPAPPAEKSPALPAEKPPVLPPTAVDAGAPPDALLVERPSEAAALDAVRVWTKAIAKHKPAAAARASALPFHLSGELTSDCPDGAMSDARALKKRMACLSKDSDAVRLIAGRESGHESYAAGPQTPQIMVLGRPRSCPALVPVTEWASHTLVNRITHMKGYPAEVLYALYAVRLVDGAARVDGACLMHEVEGD